MMLYVRAEQEDDWPLHLQAVKLMMPYFFVSRHVNYIWPVWPILSKEHGRFAK